ncbi:unnamed protein product [Brachionus calyciflorus]|uniref:G-protein coupled receptors family 1 profile domain-containing protein n=1 Tax=Brachionus calyciflorus TaxID=104777 RepID=A0A813M7S8_9BILA|nr:unnamed protein product [Brachionus calyciflorus]
MNATLLLNISNTLKNNQILNLEVPFYTILLSIIMYSLIFLIGFFGNSLVIIVAYLNRTKQYNTHYCLVNLSIADLLLIIVCMPSAILDLFSKEVWYLGRFFCKVIPWLEHTVAHASILTIVSISIERSLAIAAPLKAKRFFTNERLWLVVVFIWVLSTVSSIPIMLATTFRTAYHRHLNTNVTICIVGTGEKWQLIYLYISLFLFYLLPCFSLFILYGNIVLIIKNRNTAKKASNSSSYTNPQNSDSLILKRDDASSIVCQEFLKSDLNDDKKYFISKFLKKEEDKLSVRVNSSKKSSINSLKYTQYTKRASIQLPQINQKQIILLLIVMMLLIFVCLLPYRVFSLWVATATKSQLLKLGMVNYYNIIAFCRVAFYTNSALNPIFYHIISTKFQTAFKKFFKLSYGSSVSSVARQSTTRINNNNIKMNTESLNRLNHIKINNNNNIHI